MILVTGSTGNVGKGIVRALVARGAAVRALVRDADGAGQWEAEGVAAAIGDFAKPATLDAAFAGVQSVYALSPAGPALVDFENALIEAAVRAEVPHFVLHSVLGADRHNPISPPLRWHGAGEETLQASGLGWTILRPNSFTQNLGEKLVPFFRHTLETSDTFSGPMGDGRVSHIDIRDIAAVAATVLSEPGHTGQTYELTGPEALSNFEVAEMLSQELGRTITYVPTDDTDMRQAIAASGAPAWAVETVAGLYQYYREGSASVVTDTVRVVTGHAPRTMQDYVREYAPKLRKVQA